MGDPCWCRRRGKWKHLPGAGLVRFGDLQLARSPLRGSTSTCLIRHCAVPPLLGVLLHLPFARIDTPPSLHYAPACTWTTLRLRYCSCAGLVGRPTLEPRLLMIGFKQNPTTRMPSAPIVHPGFEFGTFARLLRQWPT